MNQHSRMRSNSGADTTMDFPTDPTSASIKAPEPDINAEIDSVVDIALDMFARGGFSQTKLGAIAKETGMSKRMIHYHFSDKKGLYAKTIRRALDRLAPPEEILQRSYAVPVDGMRRFVDSMFHSFQDNPEAVQLLIRERLEPVLEDASTDIVHGRSEITLHVERLLLVGQDAGAFRPGISADDVLALLMALSTLRVSGNAASIITSHLDLDEPRNVEGMRRMVIDTVLAFLTSNIAPSGYESYLEATPLPDSEGTGTSDDLYDIY
ncbi:TetR family transcriptional regulator [uncultured Corynebacterium sp.]|uniref:TetR family transcriptional regulator n=1 Tax=uncultured Corynebacterium sp. TaxID=159447 RepID=UPI002598449D|nr:TetR family transcriptional regulator [uncultured Corynebacterium sp.]